MAMLSLGLVLLLGAPAVEVLFLQPQEKRERLERDFGQNQSPPSAFSENDGLLGLSSNPSAPDGPRVTPLSGNDSTTLMAPGMRRPAPEGAPAAASRTVPAAEPAAERAGASSGDSGHWKDLLSGAKSGAAKAARTAALPRPTEKLAGALSGLASLASGGGSRASDSSKQELSLATPSSDRLFSGPKVTQSLSRSQAIADYRGPAVRGLDSGRNLSLSQLEGMTSKAGAYFDRQEGINSLARGAAAAAGGSDFGGASAAAASVRPAGAPDAATAQDTTKDGKTLTPPNKESLAQLKAKLEMQKQIDLKYAKMEYDQVGRKKMIEQVVATALAQTASQSFLKGLDKLLGNAPPVPPAR